MHFNIPTASLLILVSAILSVHTSPIPSNGVARIGRSSGDASIIARDVEIDLEKRRPGGGAGQGGQGGAGGAGRVGAAGAGRGNGGAGAGAVLLGPSISKSIVNDMLCASDASKSSENL
ncbi:hypothetical protein ONS96_004848 [Cadophora gregata f. sp. sojae]|nr:hypothetical protein ONS96_004848 [Cadophora gregata f. sp. sojae]